MSSSRGVTVIDLCSSDEEGGATRRGLPEERLVQSRLEATKRERIVALVSSDSSSSSSNSSLTTKRQKKEDNSSLSSSSSPPPARFEKPLVFLRTVGGDNGSVTDGIYDTVAKNILSRNVRTCCPAPEKSGVVASTTSSIPNRLQDLTLLHIGQKDKWTCGYRNLQMFLAAVVPTLPSNHYHIQTHASNNVTVDSGRTVCYEVPSQPELEGELEASWKAGFDKPGADHYGGNVRGRRKWIGAVEVWSVLAAGGIDACVCQFIRCEASRRLVGPFCSAYFSNATCPWCDAHPTSQRQVQVLLQQVSMGTTRAASTAPSNTCACPRFPLYLQWEGHSVTIIGVEHSATTREPTNLLVMDPAKNGDRLQSTLASSDLKMARLALAKLRTKECQIILASRRVPSASEREGWKRTVNVVTAASEAVMKTY